MACYQQGLSGAVMSTFGAILDEALSHHDIDTIEARVPTVRSCEALAALPDDRVLSTMAQRIFSAGFRWSVVQTKWPDIEAAFDTFAVGTVADYDEKRAALDEVSAYAQHLGVRRKVLSRIVNVSDELLMNAIYDAPEVARKNPNAIHRDEIMKAQFTYASDGRYFAVSVVDQYGELQKSMILDNLMRARAERGRPRQAQESTGAGLGIYFVLSSVTRYIANIEPGQKTEIICLFDLRQTGREAAGYASSLHIFTND